MEGPRNPCLEVGEDQVKVLEDVFQWTLEGVHLDLVTVALGGEGLVDAVAVRHHGRSRLHGVHHERDQVPGRDGRRVPEPDPPRPRPHLSILCSPFADLDRPHDDRLPAREDAGLAGFPRDGSAQEGLVHLHAPVEPVPRRVDHGGSELVEHLVGDLVPLEPEVPLELLRRDAPLVGHHEEGGEEPGPQRLASALHDRARRGALDVLARGTDEDEAVLGSIDLRGTAGGTHEVTVRPAGAHDEVEAGPLVAERPLELEEGPRELRTGHTPGRLLPVERCSQADTHVV